MRRSRILDVLFARTLANICCHAAMCSSGFIWQIVSIPIKGQCVGILIPAPPNETATNEIAMRRTVILANDAYALALLGRNSVTVLL